MLRDIGRHMEKGIGAIAGKVGLGRMSSGEYQANLSGLNTFFGAVLGFVLAGTEALGSWQFGVVLTCLASAVISIIYISSSRHRVAYAIYAFAIALVFPELVNLLLHVKAVPEKIRPTLLVWTVLTILIEFWSREKPAPPSA
jgi:hypothetical protein